jgi:hypothetical protein
MQIRIETARGHQTDSCYRPTRQEARDDLKFQLGGKRDEYAIYLAMRVLWPSWAERLHMDWWHRPPDPPLELEGL